MHGRERSQHHQVIAVDQLLVVLVAERLLDVPRRQPHDPPGFLGTCLLYTSDAADERSSVDLGGSRIIKTTTSVASNIRHVVW